MKKNLFTILTLAAVLLPTACEEVSVEERLTFVEPPEVGRSVLIEDFTGQYCVNCPYASDEIKRLVEEYGDTTIIAVALHSGPFSKQNGDPSPLYTEVGDNYFTHWNLQGQPVGLVDRLGKSRPLSFQQWGAAVNKELKVKAPVSLTADISYDDASRQATVSVQTIGLDSLPVSGKLQVWLVEDSIDSFQLLPDGSRSDHYNHMHVLRCSVNDPWGDAVSVEHGEVNVKQYDFMIDPLWVPRHCALVYFLYDDSGVRQVAKTKLIN